MKKIILSLVAIIMVSVSSACMASNKGGHHHKGNRTEVIVIHENNRGRGHYIRHDKRRYDGYRNERFCQERDHRVKCRKHRYDNRCYDCRHHHHNKDAVVAGAVLGTAALVLMNSGH
ncbi:hypothetical protein SAMN05444405_10150 [Bacteroides luti]|uniref:Lipoprotein n=1 Tax=Bacteroides luti TaxID=1297750 RepID=A0A1M4SB12_9BACE|nr:hypothetical protein [Bacteroides luti]SHE29423.1 hypothetical protein SAMN05444405_10150 [Bacteroides luti]